MIVTIDGPAGTGKSTVARRVAERLGYAFLDTGAMYRAIGLEAVRREADLADPRELAWVAKHCHVDFDWATDPPGVILNGENVGAKLRGSAATDAASHVAVVPEIRAQLVEQQQRIGRDRGDLVTEGRDQGSVVFPTAGCKVFLDADPAVRAQRRADQLRARGEVVDQQAIQRDMEQRDARDRNREVAPLRPAEGAEVIDTTSLAEDEVIERIVQLVKDRSA